MAASTKNKKTARSGNPAKRASVSEWRGAGKGGTDLELPSGNVALVKRPGPTVLLGEDSVIPDDLAPVVQKMVDKAKGKRPQAEVNIMDDPKLLTQMIDVADRVVALAVVEPAVKYHKREVDPDASPVVWEEIPDDERDTENFIYTDEIDLDDKMFIMSFAVGGTRDLKRFREQSTQDVGRL